MIDERVKELVEKHWNSYVKPLLETHGEAPEVIYKCGFHYISSGIHFYKHAEERYRGTVPELSTKED